MKTIGDYLKEARIRKKYSKEKLEKETKIKKDFIDAIEKEEWTKLPEPTVVTGFVRSIANTLGLNPNQILAFLRRDYPPKKTSINPKPELKSKFSWSPKLTFITAILAVLLIISAYLSFQYVNFVRPPVLYVDTPKEGEIVKTRNLTISGRTSPQAVIKVNNQPVLVDEDGNFLDTIEIYEKTTEIEIKAVSRSGKETVIIRKITPELDTGN
jgi:cytoskeletal protein RodZ